MFAMAAVIAWSRVRSVSSIVDRSHCLTPVAHSSARFVMIAKRAGARTAVRKSLPNRIDCIGRLDDLRARATQRVQELRQHGYDDAQIYDPTETPYAALTHFF